MNWLRRNTDYAFIIFVWAIWLVITVALNLFPLFRENWFMSVTMAVGSFVAGSTSQGGGAVAFPVMTLGFNIEPKSARDFSLMIQSVGMTSAAVAIWIRKIRVEKSALIWGTLGGSIGILIGLIWVQDFFQPNPSKVVFVSLWLAFGLALFLINRNHKVAKHEKIGNLDARKKWLFLLTAIAGGILSSLFGSGLDILIFAILVLGFGVCEKVATPTSVILMAGNSLVGFVARVLLPTTTGVPIEKATWSYWWVCVPIVALGAPLGAKFISRRGRSVLVAILISVILIQFITALFVIPFSVELVVLAIATFAIGSGIFWMVYRWGKGLRT